jgi:hypothetical protein
MSLLFLVLYQFYRDENRPERFLMVIGFGLVGTITVIDFRSGYLALAWLLIVMSIGYIGGTRFP